MDRIPSIHSPSPVGIEVADRPGVGGPGARARGGRWRRARPARGTPPTAGVGWRAATRSREVGTPCRPCRRDRVAGDGGAEVGDRCGDGRARGGRVRRARRRAGGGRPRWPPRPAGARCRPWPTDGGPAVPVAAEPDARPVVPASGRARMSPTVPAQQELGAGADELPVVGRHREHRAVRLEAVPASEQLGHVDGGAHGDVDLSGQDHLGDSRPGRWRGAPRPPWPERVSRKSGDDDGTAGPDHRRPGRPGRRRPAVGRSRLGQEPLPVGESVADGGGRSASPTRSRRPRRPVDDLGDRQGGGCRPVEGEGPEGQDDRPSSAPDGRLDMVLVRDGCQGLGGGAHLGGRSRGRREARRSAPRRGRPASGGRCARRCRSAPARAKGSMGAPGSSATRTARRSCGRRSRASPSGWR